MLQVADAVHAPPLACKARQRAVADPAWYAPATRSVAEPAKGATQYSFEVRVSFRGGADAKAFVDRLIDAVEAVGLCFGGGGRPDDFAVFVTAMDDLSATEEDRKRLGAFLAADIDVERHVVGPLVDADADPADADSRVGGES